MIRRLRDVAAKTRRHRRRPQVRPAPTLPPVLEPGEQAARDQLLGYTAAPARAELLRVLAKLYRPGAGRLDVVARAVGLAKITPVILDDEAGGAFAEARATLRRGCEQFRAAVKRFAFHDEDGAALFLPPDAEPVERLLSLYDAPWLAEMLFGAPGPHPAVVQAVGVTTDRSGPTDRGWPQAERALTAAGISERARKRIKKMLAL